MQLFGRKALAFSGKQIIKSGIKASVNHEEKQANQIRRYKRDILTCDGNKGM